MLQEPSHKPDSSKQNLKQQTFSVVYGVQKFRQYVYGGTTEVEVDSKPLQYILYKPSHEPSLRL